MCGKGLQVYFMANAVSNVNNISKTVQTANVKPADTKKLIKYVNGEALKEVPDTFASTTKSAMGSVAVFEGIPLLNFIKRNLSLKKNGSEFVKDSMNTLGQNNRNALKQILKGEGSLGKRILDFVSTSNKSRLSYSELRRIAKAETKAIKAGNKYAKIAEKLAKNPTEKLTGKAAKALNNSTKFAEKAIGEKTALKSAQQAGKTAGKFGKLGKYLKSSGAGIMLVFSGLAEMFTEVVPTFKELGKEKGMKQLGKSAVKVAGDTVGFVAGEAAGTAIGTAIGTALFPGVGTVIGAAAGFIGGMLGSFVMGKVTKGITGKSEREIAKEQQEEQQAQELSKNNESLDEIKKAAEEKVAADAADDGVLTEDSKEIQEILAELEEEAQGETQTSTNPFAA